MRPISIRTFAQSKDQEAAKALILTGLGEHFGHIDPTVNPDLDDIAASYADGVFLVAWRGDQLVGTGAFVPRQDGIAEVVRMSVAGDARRQGIATRILDRLCAEARSAGFRRLILETNSAWRGIIAFYEAYGFDATHRQQGDFGEQTYFALDLLMAD